MATLHVRNVPDELYEQVQKQAQANQRSISAEVIILLNQVLNQTTSSQTDILAGIRRRRTFRPMAVGAPDSTRLLREDRGR